MVSSTYQVNFIIMFSSYSTFKGTAALLDLCIYCDFVYCFEYMPYWLVNCTMKCPVAGITLSNELLKWKLLSHVWPYEILQARIMVWVAFPFSRGSFWPRNWTGISFIAGGFFNNWAMRDEVSLLVLGSKLTLCNFMSLRKFAIECISLHLCCHSAHS